MIVFRNCMLFALFSLFNLPISAAEITPYQGLVEVIGERAQSGSMSIYLPELKIGSGMEAFNDLNRTVSKGARNFMPPQLGSAPDTRDPIPPGVLLIAANHFSMRLEEGIFTCLPQSTIAFKSPASAKIYPWFFMSTGQVGYLSLVAFDRDTGAVAIPPAFGLRMERESQKSEWKGCEEPRKPDFASVVSCLGNRYVGTAFSQSPEPSEAGVSPDGLSTRLIEIGYDGALKSVGKASLEKSLLIVYRGIIEIQQRETYSNNLSEALAVAADETAPPYRSRLTSLGLITSRAILGYEVPIIESTRALRHEKSAIKVGMGEKYSGIRNIIAGPIKIVRVFFPSGIIAVSAVSAKDAVPESINLFFYLNPDSKADAEPAFIPKEVVRGDPVLFACDLSLPHAGASR